MIVSLVSWKALVLDCNGSRSWCSFRPKSPIISWSAALSSPFTIYPACQNSSIGINCNNILQAPVPPPWVSRVFMTNWSGWQRYWGWKEDSNLISHTSHFPSVLGLYHQKTVSDHDIVGQDEDKNVISTYLILVKIKIEISLQYPGWNSQVAVAFLHKMV